MMKVVRVTDKDRTSTSWPCRFACRIVLTNPDSLSCVATSPIAGFEYPS